MKLSEITNPGTYSIDESEIVAWPIILPDGVVAVFNPDVEIETTLDGEPVVVCGSDTVMVGSGTRLRGTNVGEHQHGISMRGVNNVIVTGFIGFSLGGDHVYIGPDSAEIPCRNINVIDCRGFGIGRNEVSIVSCEGAFIGSCSVFAPGQGYGNKGILVEPSCAACPVTSIIIADCSATRRAHGVHVQMATGRDVSVDVIRFTSNVGGHGCRSTGSGGRAVLGHVRFRDCNGSYEIDEWSSDYTEVR